MAKKIKKDLIVSRLATYNGEAQINKDCQERLKKMIEDFDLELVALASGMTESTLQQYVRVSHAPSINLKSVIKAEYVLYGKKYGQ